MKRPIAADYDLTYSGHPEIWGQTDIIITGNSWGMYDEVMSDWSGPKKPVFWNPVEPDGNVMSIISHKADIINKTKARRFYEDQKEQVDVLSALCPDCDVVWVQPERNSL